MKKSNKKVKRICSNCEHTIKGEPFAKIVFGKNTMTVCNPICWYELLESLKRVDRETGGFIDEVIGELIEALKLRKDYKEILQALKYRVEMDLSKEVKSRGK